MDFIKSIFPSNPLDSGKRSKLERICLDTMDCFAKNYLKSTTICIVQNKEATIHHQKKMEYKRNERLRKNIKYLKKKFGENAVIPNFPEYPQTEDPTMEEMQGYCLANFQLGLKPVYPRVKPKPRTEAILVNIDRYETLDWDTDPYAVYIVNSYYQTHEATKRRRFKEFQAFYKKIKGFLTSAGSNITIPEPFSKWGKRNLEPAFLNERIRILNTFLQTVVALPGATENKDILDFIGQLSPEDPLGDQIFERALRRTKWDLWIWKTIVYDKPEDGMSQLFMGKIDREMWWEINRSLVGSAESKRAQRKIAYKIINAAVNAVVCPGWKTAYSASKPVRKKVLDALDGVIGTVIEKKHEIGDKITESLVSSFVPVKETISNIMAPLTKKLSPLLVKPFGDIIKLYKSEFESKLLEACRTNDKENLKEATRMLENKVEEVKAKIEKELTAEIGKTVDGITVEVQITIEDLKEIFTPIKRIDQLIAYFVELINPVRWGKVVEEMLTYKAKIENLDPNDMQSILEEVVECEYYSLHRADWESSTMRFACGGLRWKINQMEIELGINLGSIPEICYDLGRKLQKKLHFEVMKRFIMKFSDNVWGLCYTEGDYRPWKERLDEAFLFAYNSAKKKFSKNLGFILKRAVLKILEANILEPIKKLVSKVTDPIVDTINNNLPDAIKDMIDIGEMVDKCISTSLDSTIIGVIEDQAEIFAQEVEKLG